MFAACELRFPRPGAGVTQQQRGGSLDKTTTLPADLHRAGYGTYHVGKLLHEALSVDPSPGEGWTYSQFNFDSDPPRLNRAGKDLNALNQDLAPLKKRGGKIKMRDIVIFTRQFSTMINSGLPLVQALDILAQQSENPALKDVTRQVVFDVESGNTLADAMRKHPKAFDELYEFFKRKR